MTYQLIMNLITTICSQICKVLTTKILNKASSKRKISIFTKDPKVMFSSWGEYGHEYIDRIETNNLKSIDHVIFTVDLEIYNNSSIPNIMRDMNVVFCNQIFNRLNRQVHDERIYIQNKKGQKCSILNLPSNMIQQYRVSIHLKKKDIDKIKSSTHIQLSYIDGNGKRKRVEIFHFYEDLLEQLKLLT